jgi:hypothetical protein
VGVVLIHLDTFFLGDSSLFSPVDMRSKYNMVETGPFSSFFFFCSMAPGQVLFDQAGLG